MVTAVSTSARPAPAAEAADLIARASDLAGRFATRADAHDRDGSFPFENFEELFKSGLLSLTIPIALGGSEAGAQTVVRVLQIIGQADPSTALVLSMHYLQHFIMVRSERWFACRAGSPANRSRALP